MSPNPALINSAGMKASVSPGNGVSPILSKTSTKNIDQATNILDWVEMVVFVIHQMIPRWRECRKIVMNAMSSVLVSIFRLHKSPDLQSGYTKQLRNGSIQSNKQ